nr:helix-turn-helix domain-containing protein [Prevotella nigrescens]
MHRAPGKRAVSQPLDRRVKELITGEQWSPKQISSYLAKEGVKISHETI